MACVALGLGSNLGGRLANLREAAARLSALGRITARSDVFETEPWGLEAQPRFLNSCLTMETDLAPQALLAALKGIEAAMGRRKNVRWGARCIDVDILLMGGLLYEAPDLHIPHIHLPVREFVLTPLAQILPDWRHPASGSTVAEMARSAASDHPPLRVTAL